MYGLEALTRKPLPREPQIEALLEKVFAQFWDTPDTKAALDEYAAGRALVWYAENGALRFRAVDPNG